MPNSAPLSPLSPLSPRRLIQVIALLAPAIVFAVSGISRAADAGAPAAAATIELARTVLALDPQLLALEAQARSADTAQFHLFIGSGRSQLRLRKFTLRIDDQPARSYEYSAPEWEAIAAGGLHPALSLALAAGEHRLRLELVARAIDAGPTDPRVVETLDQRLTLAPGHRLLEVSLEQARFGKAGLVQRDWPAAAAPGLIHPWLRAADYWLWSDRPFLAACTAGRAPTQGLEPALHGQAETRVATALRALDRPAAGIHAGRAGVETFNAAVAAVNAGEAQAATQLEAFGEAEAESDAAWSLRDRANLLLGYQYLRAGDGEAALKAFGRVRSPGPHGNAALLGFGWAFLVHPDAATTRAAQGPVGTGTRPAFVMALDHARANAAKERRAALQRALVPWTELIGRDALDPAAQEGSLALAWALDELGAGAQAHRYYRRAADLLELAHGLLDQAMQHVRSGGLARAVGAGQDDPLSGWRPWLADLPYTDPTGYFRYLLADAAFVETVDRYRTARQLRTEIETGVQRAAALSADDSRVAALSAALAEARTRATGAEQAARTQMENAALNFLSAQQQRSDQYLAEAHFALARHYDSAPEPEVEIAPRKARTGPAAASGSAS